MSCKHYTRSRRFLTTDVSVLPSDLQAELLEAWNRSSIPPTAAYFVEFVRTQLRRSAAPDDEPAASPLPAPE